MDLRSEVLRKCLMICCLFHFPHPLHGFEDAYKNCNILRKITVNGSPVLKFFPGLWFISIFLPKSLDLKAKHPPYCIFSWQIWNPNYVRICWVSKNADYVGSNLLPLIIAKKMILFEDLAGTLCMHVSKREGSESFCPLSNPPWRVWRMDLRSDLLRQCLMIWLHLLFTPLTQFWGRL